jgi:hypothetical protein
MAVIFLLGFFLDFIEIAVVVVPIVSPILLADPQANITAVWLGVMIGLNIQTSFLTPPFGFALFYLRGVAPSQVATTSIYKGVVPFIMLQLIALGIVGYTPSLVNYLPTRLSLLGEQAPPPINPRLQTCIEETVFVRFQTDGDNIKSAINKARGIDVSVLPERLGKQFGDSLGKAESTFQLLDDIKTAETAMNEAVPGYSPLHVKVREIERDIRRYEAEMKLAETQLRRVRGDDEEAQQLRNRLETRIAAEKAEIERLKAEIPANWTDDHAAFKKLLDADKRARLNYRRNVDQAYRPVVQLQEMLASAPQLAELKPEIDKTVAMAGSASAEEAESAIKALESSIGSVPGTNDVTKAFREASRFIRRNPDDKAELNQLLTTAQAAYANELDWRQKAAASIGDGVNEYERAIHDTIGIRSLRRLPDDIALEVASCMSHHRDVSLSF